MFIDYPFYETNTILANLGVFTGLFIYQRKTYALFPFEQNLQKKHIKVNKKLLFLSLNLIALISITAIGFS